MIMIKFSHFRYETYLEAYSIKVEPCRNREINKNYRYNIQNIFKHPANRKKNLNVAAAPSL